MNFVQIQLKRAAEKSDAGIAPQCLRDATGSSGRREILFCVTHDMPGLR